MNKDTPNAKTKCYVLRIGNLAHSIVNISYKKKTDKFVLALKKDEENLLTWYDLKAKDPK